MIFIVHSSVGLLLCARGQGRRVHYYVCNPVTWQCITLPELPWPGYNSGLLSVSANGDGTIKSFQVVLVDHPQHWKKHIACLELDLKIFSSETGQWRAMQLHSPLLGVDACSPPFLGQSGTVYWIGYRDKDRAIAYNSVCHSVRVLPVPTCVAENALNRCLGEHQGGALRYAHFDFSMFEVYDLQTDGENGMWWKLVHRIDVMELAQQNLEATDYATGGGSIEGRINNNTLFAVLGFHPIDDIIYFDVRRTVAVYSIVHGMIGFRCDRPCFWMDVFPYVHPAHPVLIPEIKKCNLAPSESNTPELTFD